MNRDQQSLLDMYQSAVLVTSYVKGLSRDEFFGNIQTRDSVVMRLLIIGEAAGRISEEKRLTLSSVEWSKIRGLRNRLIHEYDRIDLYIVWDIVQSEIADLMVTLEPFIPNSEQLSIFKLDQGLDNNSEE